MTDDRHAVDAQLVGRCLAGDGSAWERLLLRHRPLMWSIARRNGLTPDEAEEVCQSVSLVMLERLELLQDHRSLAAWVATTTARQCWRRRRRVRLETPGPDPDATVGPAPTPHDEFLAAAEREVVQRALAGLGERCRTLLTLLFVDGWTHARVAERLGLALGSIGVYRRRCLDRLARRLAAEGWARPEGRRE